MYKPPKIPTLAFILACLITAPALLALAYGVVAILSAAKKQGYSANFLEEVIKSNSRFQDM